MTLQQTYEHFYDPAFMHRCTYSAKPFPVNEGACIDDLIGAQCHMNKMSAIPFCNINWIRANCCLDPTGKRSLRCAKHRQQNPKIYLQMFKHEFKFSLKSTLLDTLCFDVIAIIFDFLDIYDGMGFASTHPFFRDVFMEHNKVVPSGTCAKDGICATHACQFMEDHRTRCTNRAINNKMKACAKHKCYEIECDNPVKIEFNICALHKKIRTTVGRCFIFNCNDIRLKHFRYCTRHKCSIGGCVGLRVNDMSSCCANCKCKVAECNNAQSNTSKYCLEHCEKCSNKITFVHTASEIKLAMLMKQKFAKYNVHCFTPLNNQHS